MANKFQNSNLVIKNGAFLLFRMLFVLFLGFFATRLTLEILGDEKFGIYNIVGGIIAVFAIISLPIRDSLQRFFNVELAYGKHDQSVVLNTSVMIVSLMVFVITILYETVGLYLINFVIKYPDDERLSVNVIFQISALANIFGFAQLPYLSLLFSRENMSVPAFCEMGGAILKIVLLYLIVYIPIDILIPYASIFLIINSAIYFFYRAYSRKVFPKCFKNKESDKGLRKEMLSFSGWSFVEAVAGISLTYISDLFINVFGGVLYNAAYGISKQLQNATISFTTNVVKAAEPQITSGTTTGNYNYRNMLLMTTMKVSFLFISFVYVFFHFDGEWLLNLWLGRIPLYVVEYCEIMLLSIVFTSIASPFRTLILATGKIKGYFICYGVISLVSILSMFVLLKMGFPVIIVMYLIMASSASVFLAAMFFANRIASISFALVMRNLFPAILTIVLTGCIYYVMCLFFTSSPSRVLICASVSFVTLLGLAYLIALNTTEKNKIKNVLYGLHQRIIR